MSDLAAWNEILADENAEMKARIRELETVIKRFLLLSVSAYPMWEDRELGVLYESSDLDKRKVYVVDADEFDKAAKAAARGWA